MAVSMDDIPLGEETCGRTCMQGPASKTAGMIPDLLALACVRAGLPCSPGYMYLSPWSGHRAIIEHDAALKSCSLLGDLPRCHHCMRGQKASFS